MDRKNKRVTYMTGANASLSAYGLSESKKKKKKKFPDKVRTVIAALTLVMIMALVLGYALGGSGREAIGRTTRIGATLSQNIMPFGDNVIFYDGTTLHCVAAAGGRSFDRIYIQAARPSPH